MTQPAATVPTDSTIPSEVPSEVPSGTAAPASGGASASPSSSNSPSGAASSLTATAHSASGALLLSGVEKGQLKANIPDFRVGDTVRVHARIVEGEKERVQIFEGVVIRRSRGVHSTATFTVRKVSYNVGVERTFYIHSPRVQQIEVVAQGTVRRARLFFLRELRGKAARIETKLRGGAGLLGLGAAANQESLATDAGASAGAESSNQTSSAVDTSAKAAAQEVSAKSEPKKKKEKKS